MNAQARPRHRRHERRARAHEIEKAPAAPPIPFLAARYIDKKANPYEVRLVLKPGNLALRDTALVSVDMEKALSIPDPVTGNFQPMTSGVPYAIVESPAVARPVRWRGRHHEEAASNVAKYRLWPEEDPGRYSFHFTPLANGMYTVTIVGFDPKGPAGEPYSFKIPFHIGAGTAALQTEASQGVVGVHRGALHPVGMSVAAPAMEKVKKLMDQIGREYLDLQLALESPPRRGPNDAAATEARSIESLMGSLSSVVPEVHGANPSEYTQLANDAGQAFENLAKDAESKGRAAPKKALAAYQDLPAGSCNECHAKYRWQVTSDVSTWPSFTEAAWR